MKDLWYLEINNQRQTNHGSPLNKSMEKFPLVTHLDCLIASLKTHFSMKTNLLTVF